MRFRNRSKEVHLRGLQIASNAQLDFAFQIAECSDCVHRPGKIFLWQAICYSIAIKQPRVRFHDLTLPMVSR